MIVSQSSLIRAARRARVGLLIYLYAYVIVITDLLLVLVVSPMFFRRFRRPESKEWVLLTWWDLRMSINANDE